MHKYFERAPLGGGLGELCWSSSVSTDLEFYVDQIGKQHASHHFTEIFQLPQKDPLFRGLGFSLAGSVSSATVVLSRKVRSQKAVEKKLIELRVGVYNVSWRGEGNYLQIFERLFQYEILLGEKKGDPNLRYRKMDNKKRPYMLREDTQFF